MKNSKPISLLKSLSPKEFKKFGAFIASPLYNNEQGVLKLFEAIKEYYPDFPQEQIKKEKLFKKIYPERDYNDGIMRNLASRILKLCEEFLIYLHLQKEPFKARQFLLRELSERRQDKLFDKNYKALHKMLEEVDVHDEEFFYKKFYLEQEHIVNLKNRKSVIFAVEDNAQEIADSLTKFFLVAILKLYTYMVNEEKHLYDYNFKLRFLDDIKNHLSREKGQYDDEPYIDLFYNALDLFMYEKEETYFKLRKIVNKHFDILEQIDRKNMYVVLANYCSDKIRLGDSKFIGEKFDLYKEIIAGKAHYEPGNFVHHIFYKRVVANALELEEFQWVEGFINEYKKDLNKEYRESNYNFCYALLNYKQGNYGEALEYLSKVKTEDISYKIEIRTLLLMIYYTTEEIDAFESMVDSFRHLVSNNKLISESWKKRENNFIKYTRKLFEIKMKKHKMDVFDVKKTIDEMSSESNVQNRHWLMEQAEALKKELQN